MFIAPEKYVLEATDIQGASILVYADTIKRAIAKFDAKYNRRGWKIAVCRRDDSGHFRIVKSTFK